MKISAHYIAREETAYHALLFKTSLLTIRKFVDEYIIVDDGCSDEVKKIYTDTLEEIAKPFKVCIIEEVEDSFSAKRNIALDNSDCDVVLWVDADEVHFTDRMAQLRDYLEDPKITALTTAFYHCMQDPFHYKEIQPRTNIFKRDENTRWELPVHEVIKGIPQGLTVNTNYTYLHLGYTKPREEVLQHWMHYAELEGNPGMYDKDNPDPNKDLHGQYGAKISYDKDYPEELSWIFDKEIMKKVGMSFE